jgi:hypothetical protein
MRKTSRGLNHPQIGRLIIPAKYVAEWDENPVWYVKYLIFYDWHLISHMQLKGVLQYGAESDHGI